MSKHSTKKQEQDSTQPNRDHLINNREQKGRKRRTGPGKAGSRPSTLHEIHYIELRTGVIYCVFYRPTLGQETRVRGAGVQLPE